MVIDVGRTRALENEDILIPNRGVDMDAGFERQEFRHMARGERDAESVGANVGIEVGAVHERA